MSIFANGALGASPALLTRMSTGPNAARAFASPLRDRRFVGHVEAVERQRAAFGQAATRL